MTNDRNDQEEDTSKSEKEVLDLVLRVAERSTDMDLHSVVLHHSEIDRSIKLGTATLGGILIVVGVFATIRYVPSGLQVVILIVGILMNLMAMLVWIFTKTGISSPKEAAVGPDLHGLVERCNDSTLSRGDVQYSLLQEYTRNGDDNQRFINSLADGRRIGVLLWANAVFLYFLGFTLVLKAALGG